MKEEWFSLVQEEYGSVEDFVASRVRGGAEPLLFGHPAFYYLLEKELLKEGDIIRTNLQGGGMDCHYKITSEETLEGIEAAGGLYSGKPGIHNPKEILNVKDSDNGWTIDFFAKHRIIKQSMEK